jgi:hypothetical protein
MRTITKGLLILNGVVLAFIVLWLLVGGSNRSYYGGGAASEVDGILLLFLGLFNVAYLTTMFVLVSRPARAVVARAADDVLDNHAVSRQAFGESATVNRALRSWSVWALTINGVLVLFVGLWLLLSTDRWSYFQANATQVDMILLMVLSVLNVAYMALACLRFTLTMKAAATDALVGRPSGSA